MTKPSASWPQRNACPNLVRDPWIPVCDLNGKRSIVSLRALFHKAADLAEIATGHAPTDAALTIFTSAVVGAAAIADNDREQIDILKAARFPDNLDAYLSIWEPKFDIASEDGGFMQVPPSQVEKIKRTVPGKTLFPDSNANDDFKMYRRPARTEVTWDQAVRALIERQLFDLGGPVSSPIVVPGNSGSHGVGGVAATSMIVYAVGRSLLETLLLNAPTRKDGDAPTWEETPTVGLTKERRKGVLRSMTARSRTALFEYNNRGNVANLVFGPGQSYEPEYVLENAAFVLAYKNNKDQVRYPKVDVGRGAWNACYMAFMVTEKSSARITFFGNLRMFPGKIRASIPIRFVGYAADKKLVKYARCEEYSIPRSLFEDPIGSKVTLLDAAEYAKTAIDCAINVIKDASRNMPTELKAKKSSEDFRARCYDVVSRNYQTLINNIAGVAGEARENALRKWSFHIINLVKIEMTRDLASLDDARKYAESVAKYSKFSINIKLLTAEQKTRIEDAKNKARPSKNQEAGKS